MISLRSTIEERVQQGDIIRDVEFLESIKIDNAGLLSIEKILFPSVFVLTQDCDLQQGFESKEKPIENERNALLISVLIAPMYNAEHFRLGNHLENLKAKTLSLIHI